MTWFRANLFHSPERGKIERIDDALLHVGSDGAILDVLPPAIDRDLPEGVIDLRDKGVLLPGLVDLHIHAPQFPQLGEALDVRLEDWLQRHTFPLEARYADLDFADRVYRALVRRLLANGTTTAVYFATIHLPASLRLAEICVDFGQRACVGRVAMDHPDTCPDFYRDADAAQAIAETESYIHAVRAIPGNADARVEPMITPRFIPACTDETLAGLGELAARTNAPIQTHCSESDWEHDHVAARCGMSDTFALDSFGLLTRRTVLAHGNFIAPVDMDLIAERGAGVAHCPLSNAYFSNAVFPLREALEKSVHVGLGTDISGGPTASLLDVCRSAVTASRMREDGTNPSRASDERGEPGTRIDFREAFWLATAGGAEVLDLPVGRFVPGCQFDAILVALPEDYLVAGVVGQTPDALLQKIVMLAQPTDIRATWVAGRQVSGDVPA